MIEILTEWLNVIALVTQIAVLFLWVMLYQRQKKETDYWYGRWEKETHANLILRTIATDCELQRALHRCTAPNPTKLQVQDVGL